MLGFGVLIFVGIASALAIGLWSARQNTLDLLADKAEIGITAIEMQVRQHLDPVAEGGRYLAQLIERGEVDANDYAELGDHMIAALAATPQAREMAFFATDRMIVRVTRNIDRFGIRLTDWSGNDQVDSVLAIAEAQSGPYWGELFWSNEAQATLMNFRTPVRRDGRFIGVLTSTVDVADLSRFLAEQARSNDEVLNNRFILYGPDRVLAHAAMAGGRYERAADIPLPSLAQSNDPILALMWNVENHRALVIPVPETMRGHAVRVDGDSLVFLYREIFGYGDRGLLVGAHFHAATAFDRALDRIFWTGMLGLMILTVSVLLALWLELHLSRPIEALARSARSLSALDFAGTPRLGRSRFREIDEAALAFNRMLTGLGWFETYVPRGLVSRLMALGDVAHLRSEEHDVTVMFTDIADFTARAEHIGAAEMTEFLNRHFSLIASAVEANDGTVDKFMGDSVMAFWGPPFVREDHVTHAIRAALGIRHVLEAENAVRLRRSEKPIRVRIGIHTGRAIVGNIGAPGRVNYTLIGDTVNVAQRLEELGKILGSGSAAATIYVSGAVARVVSGTYVLTPRGRQDLRGRTGGIEVFELN